MRNAELGSLAQRHHHDVVKSPRSFAPKLLGTEAARFGTPRASADGRAGAARDPAPRRRAAAHPSWSPAVGRADDPSARTYSKTPSE